MRGAGARSACVHSPEVYLVPWDDVAGTHGKGKRG
jgi:hypothetical protein